MPPSGPGAFTEARGAVPSLMTWVHDHVAAIPVLPDLAARVIALAADPATTIPQLAHVVGKDQVLATRLLSLANSAYSAAACEVTTIPEAVMRVGGNGVRNLAVTVCLTSRMHDRDVYGANGPELVAHGLGTAYLAHLLAERADVDPEEAFLAGLLHDIGKLVILKWHHDHVRRTRMPLRPEDLSALIAQWHPSVAGIAFRRWNLPPDLDEPVMCHHDYTTATGDPERAAVVYLANRLSHRYGFGCAAGGADPSEDPVCSFLGLERGWLATIDERAPGLYAIARRMLE